MIGISIILILVMIWCRSEPHSPDTKSLKAVLDLFNSGLLFDFQSYSKYAKKYILSKKLVQLFQNEYETASVKGTSGFIFVRCISLYLN